MRRAFVGLLLMVFLAGLWAGGAQAASWPSGSDPHSNFPPHPPSACDSAPSGTMCLKAGRQYLDKARAHLNQPAYALPSNFLSLAPDKQVFILTNLDRGVYKLPMIGGVTRELNQDAWSGVHANNDPQAGLPGFTNDKHFPYYGSNWAGGYPNVLFAYGSWMYDDGPGSPNLGCKPPHHTSECWGHRHNILLKLSFPPNYHLNGPTAMGAAAGKVHGQASYAMILGRGDGGYHPSYLFTWSARTQWW